MRFDFFSYFKLALPRESGRLSFLMMITPIWLKINDFFYVSAASDDENPKSTQLFHQNLYQNKTKLDTESNVSDKKNLM